MTVSTTASGGGRTESAVALFDVTILERAAKVVAPCIHLHSTRSLGLPPSAVCCGASARAGVLSVGREGRTPMVVIAAAASPTRNDGWAWRWCDLGSNIMI